MSDQPILYPFESNFLDWVRTKENLNAETIYTLIEAIQEWLSENVSHSGKDNYKWSDTIKFIPTAYGSTAFSDKLYFAYEEDLIAFRLRWGIQG